VITCPKMSFFHTSEQFHRWPGKKEKNCFRFELKIGAIHKALVLFISPLNWYWHSFDPKTWPLPSATTASGDSMHLKVKIEWVNEHQSWLEQLTSFFCFGERPGMRLQRAAGAKLNNPLRKRKKIVIKTKFN
jgi:hypothetical protein